MLLGILSDTHDRIEPARAAVNLLLDRGAQRLIHCGDVGSERILDLLIGHQASFVFGNNDLEHTELANYAAAVGVECLHSFGSIEVEGKRFAITHGDDPRLLRQIIDADAHDYLLFGHTHVPCDRRERRIRLINPGALHRAAQKTVAILNLATDQLEFVPLPVANF